MFLPHAGRFKAQVRQRTPRVLDGEGDKNCCGTIFHASISLPRSLSYPLSLCQLGLRHCLFLSCEVLACHNIVCLLFLSRKHPGNTGDNKFQKYTLSWAITPTIHVRWFIHVVYVESFPPPLWLCVCAWCKIRQEEISKTTEDKLIKKCVWRTDNRQASKCPSNLER